MPGCERVPGGGLISGSQAPDNHKDQPFSSEGDPLFPAKGFRLMIVGQPWKMTTRHARDACMLAGNLEVKVDDDSDLVYVFLIGRKLEVAPQSDWEALCMFVCFS